MSKNPPPLPASGSGANRSVGIVLRVGDLPEFLAARPPVHWVEVNSENYMRGGAALRALAAVRRAYDVSLHGVGLSLGSADGLQADHLARLVALNSELEPALVSEHLSWSIAGNRYFNALLPLPYTKEALGIVCRNIDIVQDALRRPILVENVAAYVRFRHSEFPEPEFLTEISRYTGCGILCDVNNVFISCRNLGMAPLDYIHAITPAAISQFHLGGHSRIHCHDRWLLFDDHGAAVDPAVWDLYREAVLSFGPKPTLIEGEAREPGFTALLNEAERAHAIMSEAGNCSEAKR